MKLLRSTSRLGTARRVFGAVLALSMAIAGAAVIKASQVNAYDPHAIQIATETKNKDGRMLQTRVWEKDADAYGGTVSLVTFEDSEWKPLETYESVFGYQVGIAVEEKDGYELTKLSYSTGGVIAGDVALDTYEVVGAKKVYTDFHMCDEDVQIIAQFTSKTQLNWVVYYEVSGSTGTQDATLLDDPSPSTYVSFQLPYSTFDYPDDKYCYGWEDLYYRDHGEGPVYYAEGSYMGFELGQEYDTYVATYVDFDVTVSFWADGVYPSGTMDSYHTSSRAEAEIWTFPECGFIPPDGCMFDYWKTAYEEDGKCYPGQTYSLYGNGYQSTVAMVAMWKPYETTYFVVGDETIDVYDADTEYGTVLGQLTFGQVIAADYELTHDGTAWVRFKYQVGDEVVEGWVKRSSLFLTYSPETAIVPQTTEVTANSLNIRSAPDADADNRISGVTKGKVLLVTGYLDNGTPDDTSDDWLVLDYTMPSGKHTLAFVMAKYATAVDLKWDIDALDISGALPTGYSLTPNPSTANGNQVGIDADSFGNSGNGLYTAIIYPANGFCFDSLTKDKITIPDSFELSVMDLVLNEDGSIEVTLGPIAPVKISFVGSDEAEFLAKYVSEGKTVTKPEEAPTKEGATFTGWYADEECTVEFDFSKPVTGDISIFAGFALNESSSTEVQEQSEEKTETTTEEQAPVSYTVICEDPTFVRGSGKPFVVTVKRSVDDAELCFEMFRNAYIDGKPLVKDQNYTAEKGSTIITIKTEALEALEDGTHTITIEFADGKVEYTFTLAQPEAKTEEKKDTTNTDNTATTDTPTPTKAAGAKPKTGDVGSSSRMVAVLVVAMIGTAALVLLRRENENAAENE